jgi:MutS2 family protein
MNQKALNTLEYTKIIKILASYASSPMGRTRCLELFPANDITEITYKQRQTHDALNRLFKKGNISFGGATDIRPSLKRLDVGATLGINEFLLICNLLENCARVKSYGRNDRDDAITDTLADMFDTLNPLTNLSTKIRQCIISEDTLSDDASTTLKQIRRSIRNANERIHTQLNSMLGGSARTYLQDAVITMRNGRYCIPVKAEYKSQVHGMVHDQSATGSTFFIEPMAIVKLNNDIRELEIKESAEIEVILANLSQLTAENTEVLGHNLDIMVELDFIFARATLAMEQNANEPIFNTDGRINIRQARHPLIDKDKVVPINIHLGNDFDLLIVTGPNTGGKTVSLKTVGLLSLMGQAGLHIPALTRSELAIFNEIYADIGDEQSIEQSLSTFSSHMSNVVRFLEDADENSLVLFDELGAGTDPTEGAALAISILSYLHDKGVRTMATTHYSELKIYALSTAGVENACCEFDIETLRPTYRLLIGIPGKSNAFAISSKLGLPDFIVEDAKGHISKDNESFEDVISDLELSRKSIEQEQLEIAAAKSEITKLQQKLSDKYDRSSEQKERILKAAHEEAHNILRRAKEEADETIRYFNKINKANGSIKEMEATRQKLRGKLSDAEKKMSITKNIVTTSTKASDLHIGDMVKIISMNLKGTVSTLPDTKGSLFVQAGIIRTKTSLSDIILVADPTDTKSNISQLTGSGKIKMQKAASIKPEINLLGKTVDEAIAELDKYLDDAYLSHLQTVRVVHGKGTGALRKGVHNYLKKLKYVSSFQLGEFGEGDAGVTIVTFK